MTSPSPPLTPDERVVEHVAKCRFDNLRLDLYLVSVFAEVLVRHLARFDNERIRLAVPRERHRPHAERLDDRFVQSARLDRIGPVEVQIVGPAA